MKHIKKFNEYNINESVIFNKHNKIKNKIINKLNIKLSFLSKYTISFSESVLVIEKILIKNFNYIDDYQLILYSMYIFSILLKENKNYTKKLYQEIKDNNYNIEILEELINQFINIKNIFIEIANNLDKKIITIDDMLSYTELYIPYIYIFNKMIDFDKINLQLLALPFNEFKNKLGDIKYGLFIDRIYHKLSVINNNDKIKNIKNLEPFNKSKEFYPKYLRNNNF
jgi:hypothetical protein